MFLNTSEVWFELGQLWPSGRHILQAATPSFHKGLMRDVEHFTFSDPSPCCSANQGLMQPLKELMRRTFNINYALASLVSKFYYF